MAVTGLRSFWSTDTLPTLPSENDFQEKYLELFSNNNRTTNNFCLVLVRLYRYKTHCSHEQSINKICGEEEYSYLVGRIAVVGPEILYVADLIGI